MILGILAVAIAFSFSSNKLVGAANKLMFDLRYAQQLAISQQVSCGVSFNPSDNSYFAYVGDISTIATDPHTRGELSVDYDTDSDYSGISLVNTNFGDQISFDYLGTPNYSDPPDDEGTITLQWGSSPPTTVTIEPNTGEVKIP